ncbi:peptide/nickel transport system ATP-binding protein [Lachnospiraceae bacterium G41]|nr:peptide/nickel transport system ATP-binding protein [Lachnospiraceae bacterium G41]
MSEKVCEVKNLTYYYPKSDKGVKDVSLYVNKGSIVGLLGESGCGKSTLAKCISAQLTPEYGEIICKKIGYIFQDNYASLNPAKKVGWLLKETIKYANPEKFFEYEKRIKNILEDVELDETVLEHYPSELSGGQRQRIGIAMALLSNPDILIADEPVSALDVTVQKQVIKLIKKLNERKNLAILFISHDIKVVREICNYIYILKDGELVEEGESETLFTNPSSEYTKNLLDSSYLE